jgi:hypothetical protein
LRARGAEEAEALYAALAEARATAWPEVFDPATGTFSAAPDRSSRRESHTATLLPNGAILITGGGDGTIGYSPTIVLASSDLYVWH